MDSDQSDSVEPRDVRSGFKFSSIFKFACFAFISALLPSVCYASGFVDGDQSDMVKPRIVVVGCGFAGLELMKNLLIEDKFEVIGLEARDRVGGRVFTDENGNELGAAWIHGIVRNRVEDDAEAVEWNPVYQLAKEFIEDSDLVKTEEFVAVNSDGSQMASDSNMWQNMWKALNVIKKSEEAQEYAYKPTDMSVRDYISNHFKEIFEHVQYLNPRPVVKTVIEWQSYYATLWEECSIGSMGVDKEFDGDQLLIKNGGYTRVLNHYLGHYGLNEHIRLNSPVGCIEKLPNQKSRVHINDGSGSFIDDVDIVVVTVPLGVLKKNGIVFIPDLPQRKRDAIDRLGFGVYDKIFITFEDSIERDDTGNGFWVPGSQTISIVPKADDDFNQYVLSLNPLQPQDPESPRPYNERDNDHIGIEMSNISQIAGKPKVVMLIYGEAAEAMEAIAHDQELLTNFARSKLENAFPDRIIPRIVSVEATTWGIDPYAYGSFANIPLGSSGQDMLILSEPIENRILFDGEASFPLHFSTVHGALKSGRREFARIMSICFPDYENIYAQYLEDPNF